MVVVVSVVSWALILALSFSVASFSRWLLA